VHDSFDIIGVSRGARAAEIRRASRRRASRSHPDVTDAATSLPDAPVWTARAHGAARRTAGIDRDAAVRFARVDPLVTRMRRAFFGEAPPCPAVHVRVTPWQVRAGLAAVTVDVPLPRACGTCQGRGEVTDDLCWECWGAGVKVQPQPARVPLPQRLVTSQPIDLDVMSAPSSRAIARLRVTFG
jgi:hypothetical protein